MLKSLKEHQSVTGMVRKMQDDGVCREKECFATGMKLS